MGDNEVLGDRVMTNVAVGVGRRVAVSVTNVVRLRVRELSSEKVKLWLALFVVDELRDSEKVKLLDPDLLSEKDLERLISYDGERLVLWLNELVMVRDWERDSSSVKDDVRLPLPFLDLVLVKVGTRV